MAAAILCARFPRPQAIPASWTRVQQVHHWYHHPDYFCPEPYETYPSHLHIDLLARAQGRGFGRRMLEQVMDTLRQRGSPGAHLGVSMLNHARAGLLPAAGLPRTGPGRLGKDGCIYWARALRVTEPDELRNTVNS